MLGHTKEEVRPSNQLCGATACHWSKYRVEYIKCLHKQVSHHQLQPQQELERQEAHEFSEYHEVQALVQIEI